jgi:hypothetical protein
LFNPVTDFNINSQYEEIIDGDGDEEYANITLSLGLVRRFFLGNFQLNFGRTRLAPEQSDATKSNYFDIQLNRDQFLWHDVSLIYLEDISDTSIGFESDEQGELLESSSERSASGSDIIKRKRLDLSLNRVFGNTNYVVNGFWERELFVSQGVEEASLGVSINVEYSLSRNVVSELRYSYQEDDFSDRADEGKDKRSSYTVGAQYNLSSSLSINSFIRFSSRYNKQNMTREYEEFTTGFGLNWSFLE